MGEKSESEKGSNDRNFNEYNGIEKYVKLLVVVIITIICLCYLRRKTKTKEEIIFFSEVRYAWMFLFFSRAI